MAGMDATDRQRNGQIFKGVAFLLGITGSVCAVLAGWGHLPDVLAEWIGWMIGIATSPFFMEVSCIVIGFVLIVGINHWRNLRDGDEFVTLPQESPNPIPREQMSPTAITPPPPRKVMNVESFLRLSFGDVAGLCRLASEYLKEIRDDLPTWSALSGQGNYSELRLQLHRSRGSAAQFGFERLSDMIHETEIAGFLEQHGFPAMRFTSEIEEVEQALSQLRVTFEA